jgi:divalent metal cation (Fe/Co/Zn/Cd) transporter
MDHLAAGVVAGMIVYVGVAFFRKAASDLMDTILPEKELAEFREQIMLTSGVSGLEVLAARKSGLGVLVDAHVEVDPKMSVEESHTIASRVRDDLKQRFPVIQNVLVHIEPYYPNDH